MVSVQAPPLCRRPRVATHRPSWSGERWAPLAVAAPTRVNMPLSSILSSSQRSEACGTLRRLGSRAGRPSGYSTQSDICPLATGCPRCSGEGRFKNFREVQPHVLTRGAAIGNSPYGQANGPPGAHCATRSIASDHADIERAPYVSDNISDLHHLPPRVSQSGLGVSGCLRGEGCRAMSPGEAPWFPELTS